MPALSVTATRLALRCLRRAVFHLWKTVGKETRSIFNLIIGFVMDVLIFWGTAMGTAMSATAATNNGQMSMPPAAVVLFALTVAIVQAGRRWDSKTAPSPIKPDTVTVRSPAQLAAQIKAREAAAPVVVVEPSSAPPSVTPGSVL